MKILLTIILSAIILSASAQKKALITYFTKDGKEVKSKDDYYFTRVIQPLNDGTANALLTETYRNGNPKKAGKILNNEGTIRFDGEVTYYYETGIKSKTETFSNNQIYGLSNIYNSKGDLKEQRNYFNEGLLKGSYKLLQYVDSTGRKLLDENNSGFVAINYPNGNTEYGNYLNGLKDGIWKSTNFQKKEGYEDIYDEGIFKSGKTFAVDGTISTYEILERKSTYPGGSKAMGTFIAKNLRYPPAARENKIQGKVVVRLKINEDGSLSDFSIIQSLSSELDQEAIRVLKLIPGFLPGIKRGKAYSELMTFPFNFNLR